ncbi:unnamed protein product [Dicrocoelium dendriticum]|nr:unnamed protein product [Dicrocoelium dendriticum]
MISLKSHLALAISHILLSWTSVEMIFLASQTALGFVTLCKLWISATTHYKVLGKLSSLTELWMDDNEIQSIPAELGLMQRLQQLDLSENMIGTLPDEISGLLSLCDLNLSQNSLSCLPNSFGELKKLTVVKLNQNRLITLTSAIGGCSNLQELYLTENFLSSLPPTLGDLKSMFLLNVDQNQLTELPTEIGGCTSLNILSLRENLLRYLPAEIGNCCRLRVLDISENRLERLPMSLANCPLTALWLSQNQSQPVVTLQRDVDELTHEEFLTCYLLPQDQLTSQAEMDPTLSPSDLASINGPIPAGDASLTDVNTIHAEANYAYEPATSVFPNLTSGADVCSDNGTHPPTSVISSTNDGVLNPSSPISPMGTHSRPPRQKSPIPRFSPSPRASFSMHSGDYDPGSSGLSRVHFSSAAKPSESEKAFGKGFPKTRHPRFSRKMANGPLTGKETRPFKDMDLIGEPRKSGPNISAFHTDNMSPLNFETVGLDNCTNDARLARLASFDSMLPSVTSHATPVLESDGGRTHAPVCPLGGVDSSDRHDTNTADLDGFHNVPAIKPRRKIWDPEDSFAASAHSANADDTTSDSCNADSFTSRGPPPAESVDAEREHSSKSDTVVNADDEEAYSSGGEEICVISRRVGFTEDVEDNEEKSNQKLIRRDTPHYTKRARIQSKTADGVDSEEAVLKILEKYRSTVSPGGQSGMSDSTRLLLAAALSSSTGNQDHSSYPASGLATAVQKAQQRKVIHIHRQPGCGLGLSIAGGAGSIPYLGSDQGIFVSRLNPNGLAFSSGLRLNDKIIEVNGTSLVNVEHHVAVSALRGNADDFYITVLRDVAFSSEEPLTNAVVSSPSSAMRLENGASSSPPIRCTLYREPSGFGFVMTGVRGTSPSVDREKITIHKIINGGAASKCGSLQVGDEIVKVNGIDVTDSKHDQVMALIAGSLTRLELEVIRPSTGHVLGAAATASPVPPPATGQMSPRNPYTLKSPPTSCQPCQSPKTKESWLGTAGATVCPTVSCTATERPLRLRMENGYPVELVTVRLNGGPLGLAIYGGSDINCLPFSDKEPGIFISKISTDGAAQHTGLRVGDRILRVNDIDLRNATHDEAVRALVQVSKEIKLEIRRDPAPLGLRRITINRRVGERFGFRISGGVQSSSNEPTINALSNVFNDGGIFVTWISPDGAVGLDGRLKPGDRLLEVNGHWMMGVTLEDSLEVFRRAGPTLNLVVCDGPLDIATQSKCGVGVPLEPVAPKNSTLDQRSQPLDSRISGSAVDQPDEIGNDLHSNVAYSDAKRQLSLAAPRAWHSAHS